MATDVGTIVGYLALDARQFDEAIAKAIAEIKALKDTDIKVKVDASALSGVKAEAEKAALGLDKVGTSARESSDTGQRSMHLLLTSIVALGPALVPLSAGVAGAGLALGGMGAAGLLAIKGIQNAMKAGTHDGLVFQSGIGDITTALHGLEAVAAHNVLGPFQTAVGELRTGLPSLSGDVGILSREMGSAGTALVDGLLAALHTLAPVMETIGGDVVGLAQRFDTFAHGNGLQSFANYVLSVWPSVEQTLGSLATTVGHVVLAFAPMGSGPLMIVRLLAEAIGRVPVGVLQAVAPLATAAYLGFTAWKSIAPVISGVTGALGAERLALLGVADAERAANVASGIVGVAIAGLSLLLSGLGQQADTSAIGVQGMVQALVQSNGALTENVRLTALKNVTDSGMLANARALGVSAADTVNYYLGQASALDDLNKVRDGALARQAALVNAGRADASTVSDVETHYLNLKNEMASGTKAMANARQEFKDQKSVMDQSAQATNAAATAQGLLASQLHTTVGALAAAKASQQQAAVAAAQATTKMQLENDAGGLLKQTLDALNGKAISAAEATNNLDSALTGMSKSTNRSTASLKGMSQGSIDARQSLVSQTQAAFQSAQANGDLSGSNMHARQTLIDLRDKIIANAVAHGYNRQSVQKYIDTVFKIPKDASTLLTVKDAAALSQINNFRIQLDRINGKVVTTTIRNLTENIVSTKYNGVGGASDHGMLTKSDFFGGIESFRDGGILDGLLGPQATSFASGGMLPSSAMIAPDGANLIQWAESGTGGEAFIPLGGYNHDRSVQIWEETGRRLGVRQPGPVVVYVQSPIDSQYILASVAVQAENTYKAQAAAAEAQARVATRALTGVKAQLGAETRLANQYRKAEEMWKARALQ